MVRCLQVPDLTRTDKHICTRTDKCIRCEDTCAPDAARQRAFLGHTVCVRSSYSVERFNTSGISAHLLPTVPALEFFGDKEETLYPQVSVDTLIEEYAGAYDGQEPRVSKGMAYHASGPSQILDASSYEMRLRGLSGIISDTEMDSFMKLEAMEQGMGANAVHEPLDETHTWQHVTSLPISQQPSGTDSYSYTQLDGVSATIEEDLTLSGKVSKAGLDAGRASVRSGVEAEEVDEDSSSEDEPTQSESTSRTESSANPDCRNTPVVQQDGPPSMWGNGPLFPRH